MDVNQWRLRQQPATTELRVTLQEGARHGPGASWRDAAQLIDYLRSSLVVHCGDGGAVRVWSGLAVIEEGAHELYGERDPARRQEALGRLLTVVDDVLVTEDR